VSRRRQHDAGFALVLVLWTLVLLALIGSQIGVAGRTEAAIARNLLASAQAEAAADAAVYEAVFRLIDHSAAGWIADGRTRLLDMGDARASVTVQDDAGKLNPNAATPEALVALLGAIGAPGGAARAITDAIVEWRGSQDGTPDASAAAYRAAGLPYRPPAAPFVRTDEVGLVLGMTPELYSRAAPYLSVAQRGITDLSVADPVVVRAMGGRTEAASRASASPYTVKVITVIARVEGARGGTFTRIAVLQVGTGPALPKGYAVIAWDTPAAP
jgi:general secretion pathway protein K